MSTKCWKSVTDTVCSPEKRSSAAPPNSAELYCPLLLNHKTSTWTMIVWLRGEYECSSTPVLWNNVWWAREWIPFQIHVFRAIGGRTAVSHFVRCIQPLSVKLCVCVEVWQQFVDVLNTVAPDKARLGQRLFHAGLSQKNSLQTVSGHAALVLRLRRIALWVRAAGRGALWGAQVVHEGQPVLPAEVHKFDLAHTWVKVDAWRKSRATGRTKPSSSGRSVTCIIFILKQNNNIQMLNQMPICYRWKYDRAAYKKEHTKSPPPKITKTTQILFFQISSNTVNKGSYRHIWGLGTCWQGQGSAAGLRAGLRGSREYFGS